MLSRDKIRGLRWIVAALLFSETLLAYLDLQEFSVLGPIVRKELNIDDSQYAFITQAFLVAYTITFCLGGLVIDRLGVRKGLTVSLIWWSTANMFHAFANTGGGFAFWRFVLGLGYPGAFLSAARAVSEWYPVQERALVYGIYVSGSMVGAVIAYPLVVWMSLTWSWRGPFLITGLAGLLLAIVWFIVYRGPEQHPWITEKEREHVRAGRVEEDPDAASTFGFRHVLRTRPFWAVAIGRFISDSTWMFYVLWLAKFLVEAHGMSVVDMGRYGWIPFVFAYAGSVAGGWFSGRLIRGGMNIRSARIVVLTLCAGVRAFTFLLDPSWSTPVLISAIGILMMCTTAWQVNLSVMIVDSYPSRLVATAAGVTTSFGTFSTVFFQSVVAWLLVNYSSYRPVLALVSILAVVAYIVVRLILRGAPSTVATNLKPVSSAA